MDMLVCYYTLLLFYLLSNAVMENTKASFIIRKKYRKQIELLDNEKAWMLFKAIMKLQDWETLENVEPVISILLSVMEEEWKLDNERYEEVCNKNRENVKKRWNKNTTVYDRIQSNTNGYDTIPLDTKNTDNDNDIWYINKKENNKKKKRDLPSVVELVRAYEWNDLLSRKIKDTEAVRLRAEYKQGKTDRAYKTTTGFIQQLVWAVKKLENGLPRADVWERLKFAVNVASEREWKDIYWTADTENDYQSFKSFQAKQWTTTH